MLSLVCPKAIEANITKTEVNFTTIAELDADLQKAGLPPTREIFQLDYRGTAVPDAEEAEVVDAQQVVVVAEAVIKEGE
jgi:hypothetical protein